MIKYVFAVFVLLQLSCFSDNQELNHIISAPQDLESLKALVNEGSQDQYNILYYSADYASPCKKIKKMIDAGVSKESFKNIRLIEINQKDYGNRMVNPVWSIYRVETVPTFIHVDKSLRELNRGLSRTWKRNNPKLDKFIKDLWPPKTPEELTIEAERKNQDRNRSRLNAELSKDSSLTNLTRGFYQDEVSKNQEALYGNNSLEIRKIEQFKKLGTKDFKDTKKLQISFNRFSPQEQQVILKELPKFVNLEYLHFTGKQAIPDEVFKLKNIKFLFINGNYGKIPLSEKIIELRQLEHIQFGYSSIELPANINQLKNLKSILMPGPAIEQPKELFMIENLLNLSLKFSKPADLENVKNLKNLKFLESNHYFKTINSLTNLRMLKLNSTELGDISNLKKLKILSLYRVNGHEMDKAIFSLPSLSVLFIFDPKGFITFPPDGSDSNALEYVLFSYNKNWPEIEIPNYIRKAKHYVEFVKR